MIGTLQAIYTPDGYHFPTWVEPFVLGLLNAMFYGGIAAAAALVLIGVLSIVIRAFFWIGGRG